MSDKEHGLSMVVPAFNEETGILDTIDNLKRVLNGMEILTEIIVVSDGSTDATLEIVGTCDDIQVVSHPVNIGYGNAIISGVLKARYGWIGIIDADGTYPIDDIPRLAAEMNLGYDMVVGSRVNISEHDSLLKRISREIFKTMVSLINDSRIEDPNSGMRIFKREIVLKLRPFLCGRFSFTTSISILMSGLYYFISYVPIVYAKRSGKSKVRHFRDSIQALQFIVQGVEFFNPMKFFIILACLLFLLVYLPGTLLLLFHLPVVAILYSLFGTAVSLMVGMGALGDIIRIASAKQTNDYI